MASPARTATEGAGCDAPWARFSIVEKSSFESLTAPDSAYRGPLTAADDAFNGRFQRGNFEPLQWFSETTRAAKSDAPRRIRTNFLRSF
jgi:hypothetical protein